MRASGHGCGLAPPARPARCSRDNPGRELELTVVRGAQTLAIPVTPAPSPKDGSGRIGISLASNADVARKKAANPVDAVSLAGQEFVKLTGTVLKGAWAALQAPRQRPRREHKPGLPVARVRRR